MTDHYSEFRQLPPEDDKAMLTIEITSKKQVMGFSSKVTRQEIDELVQRVMDGEVISVPDYDGVISVEQYTASCDICYNSAKDLAALLTGNTAKLEVINERMANWIRDQLIDMFQSYDVEVER